MKHYDLAVVGGGLAGLTAAIMTAKAGFSVVLFEKEKYPFHKVCGEYISLESWDLLLALGVDLEELALPVINELTLSSPNGKVLTHKLPLGGFGVSRFVIDDILMNLALEAEVDVREQTKVNDIHFTDERFFVSADNFEVSASLCCGAFGKRSNIDVKLNRQFIRNKPNRLNNLIGVKYHVHLSHPRNNIALHNFSKGYCGISPIEEDKTCICYLTTALNLKQGGNDLKRMEEAILFKNPFIRSAFKKAQFIHDKPFTISQVSFENKAQVENHIIMAGDASGMIAPLCGNGMSMALHAGRMASLEMVNFLQGKSSRKEMELKYEHQWRKSFSTRLTAGKFIQRLFTNDMATNMTVSVLKKAPFLLNKIVSQTHG